MRESCVVYESRMFLWKGLKREIRWGWRKRENKPGDWGYAMGTRDSHKKKRKCTNIKKKTKCEIQSARNI